MTRQNHHGIIDGWLAIMCTCDSAVMLASPREVRNGVGISCGQPHCHGLIGERPGQRGRANRKRKTP